MAAETTRAVGYIRTATTTRANREHCTGAQAQRIRRYCFEQRMALVGTFADYGVMGDHKVCTGLRDALSLLQDGRADVLVVVNVSRLSRSIGALTRVVEAHFADGSRALVSLDEAIDTRTPNGRLILSLLQVLGRWEVEAIGHA